MDRNYEADSAHDGRDRSEDIKWAKELNKRFPTAEMLDHSPEYVRELTEKIDKIEIEPVGLDKTQIGFFHKPNAYLEIARNHHADCISILESNAIVFSEQRQSFISATSRLRKIKDHKRSLKLRLDAINTQDLLEANCVLAESMAASRDYIGLRKIILEKKALLDKIKEILPNTAINTKYLELDLKLTGQITTELGKSLKALLNDAHVDNDIGALCNLADALGNHAIDSFTRTYSKTFVEYYSEKASTDKKIPITSRISENCARIVSYFQDKSKYGLSFVPRNWPLLSILAKDLLTAIRKNTDEALALEPGLFKSFDDVIDALCKSLKLEFDVTLLALENSDEALYGTFSRSFAEKFRICLNSETDSCIKRVNKSRIPQNRSDLDENALDIANDIFGSLPRHLSKLREAGGGWPLIEYSEAMQKIAQSYTKFLSTVIYRPQKGDNLISLCFAIRSAEYIETLLESIQRKNLSSIQGDHGGKLMFTEECISLSSIISNATKSLISRMHSLTLPYFSSIPKSFINSIEDNAVQDKSPFIIKFNEIVNTNGTLIKELISDNSKSYWNYHKGFLEITANEFKSTMLKLKPINDEYCQKLLIDIYYIYNILLSLPKGPKTLEGLNSYAIYRDLCNNFRSEVENILKILLHSSNGPSNVAGLFVHLFPEGSVNYLENILNLSGLSLSDREEILSDFYALKTPFCNDVNIGALS